MLRLSNRRSNFFLKIELNRNRFFGWYFFDFDSRYIGEDNALLRVQSMTVEPWQRVLNTPT